MSDYEIYLASGTLINSDHPDIVAFAKRVTEGSVSDQQRAIRIYFAIRDNWRYNPYNISLSANAMQASGILKRSEGHCLDKAILMIACLRAVGIPARLCLAKVKNHIAVERLVEAFGTDELVPHGYVDVYLNSQWIKATPAFNRQLCERLGVPPLDWDGEHDSMFQAFDKEGNNFMEYLEEYGHFKDVPMDTIESLMVSHYPDVFQRIEGNTATKRDFFQQSL
ncbi:MAG: transglutaminase family protein [Saprospiraceae bacterium]|nr:transglutaminase family protein [Saprospiraceae bacterium]